MRTLITPWISILPFVLVFTGCDSSTAPDAASCPDLITGGYDLVTFEGQPVPSWFQGKACLSFWCSDYTVRILSGELALSEDGTFEEVGNSQSAGATEPVDLRQTGTYVVHGNSIDFHFDNALFPGPYAGECTSRGIELESRAYPFRWGSFGESAHREWEKR